MKVTLDSVVKNDLFRYLVKMKVTLDSVVKNNLFRYLVKRNLTLDSVVLLAICVDLFLSRVVRLTKSVSSIPDICHERHEYICVNFFWPV